MPAVYVGRKTHCIVMAVPNVEGGGVETNKNKNYREICRNGPNQSHGKGYIVYIYIYTKEVERLCSNRVRAAPKQNPLGVALKRMEAYLCIFRPSPAFLSVLSPNRGGQGKGFGPEAAAFFRRLRTHCVERLEECGAESGYKESEYANSFHLLS